MLNTATTSTESSILVFQQERARSVLSELLTHSSQDNDLRPEIEKIIGKMFEYNPQLEPDSLTRAAFFFVKSSSRMISEEDVRNIAHDGVRDNYTWPALVPVIKSVLTREK